VAQAEEAELPGALRYLLLHGRDALRGVVRAAEPVLLQGDFGGGERDAGTGGRLGDREGVEETALLSALSAAERRTLADLLRKLVLAAEDRGNRSP
jgi:hypothetical protein